MYQGLPGNLSHPQTESSNLERNRFLPLAGTRSTSTPSTLNLAPFKLGGLLGGGKHVASPNPGSCAVHSAAVGTARLLQQESLLVP